MKHLKLILIGYGRMGQEIRKMAEQRGHEVILMIDKHNQNEFTEENLQEGDVAVEFTVPDSAYDNILKCFNAKIPVVSGTTGWLDKYYDIRRICLENNNSFFHAANFNIGVNLFFKLNSYLAKIMNNYDQYDVEIEEAHHKHKIDAPSGTAVQIAESIIQEMNRKNKWVKKNANDEEELAVRSIREGEIPGIHKVFYKSPFDEIEIKHSAKSREGFALGAVMAAEFLHDKTGIFSMDDLLKI